uniref:Glutaredoxin n=1 Tax=Amphora coffeiformis TaxID=265554 RepID=A0A7S3L5Z3_9STRA|mmetsp:Transcript_1713/g.3733  ORF Transcript_1713/g.3733 Transcript_1713/m.3733 type:complete len:345 (+) Transcript_1713:107-1141(+)|eukprot:scaffold8602_cov196-Amphora_coffeaeformis.AAC.21
MSTVVELKEAPPAGHKAVLLFYAAWHDSTAAMENVLQALVSTTTTTTNADVLFAKIEAETCPAVSKQFGVTSVPTFVLVAADGAVYQKLEGAQLMIASLTQAVQKFAQETTTSTATAAAEDAQAALTARLDSLIRSAPVMLFIKGTPSAPKCGFSRQAVELLQEEKIPFGSFDILSDDAVRQGLKKHSDWPTYPQLYVKGELMGGLDIMKEMKEEQASLENGLGLTAVDMAATPSSTAAAPTTLEDRLKALINQNRVMLFMKGLPSGPRCGFSRQMVQLLEDEGISYGSFDILTDNAVREGLKTYSDWPTYPQLYVNGELIGGLDIVKEMKDESGSLKEALLQS